MNLKTTLLGICFVASLSSSSQETQKVLILTDKQFYYPGESILFSVHILDACTNKPVHSSGVVYTDLIDENNSAAIQTKVKAVDARGSGSIQLDAGIATGAYLLRAYTGAMKGVSYNTNSHVVVHIVNPIKPGKLRNMASDDRADEPNKVISIHSRNSSPTFGKREMFQLNIASQKKASVSVSVIRKDSLENGECYSHHKFFESNCNTSNRAIGSSSGMNDEFVVTARVIDKRTNTAAPGKRGYLSVVNEPHLLYSGTSDSAGNINFRTHEISGKKELVLQTAAADSNYSIVLQAPLHDAAKEAAKAPDWDVFATNPVTVAEALTASQVQARFSGNYHDSSTSYEVDTTPFYGAADGFYRMKDYVRFTTVEDILREYVTTVGVQNRRGQPVPLVVDAYTNVVFEKPPLVLIDGVPLFDIAAFMELDPDEFESIAVVARRFHMGYDVFEGIIDVRLNTRRKKLPQNVTVADFEGVQPSAPMNVTQYVSETQRASRKPDFRTVLYWAPHLELNAGTDNGIVGYTSDLDGAYEVIVHGFTEDGKPVCSKSTIEVK